MKIFDMPIQLYIAPEVALPDNDQWRFRFTIKSATSNRLYTISQHKKKRFWACSCPGWITNRKCKHLTALGLPNDERPYEVDVVAHR
jgi:hypothetical protein